MPTSAQAGRPPILVGVGVGPGDPELITLKAVALLRSADVVLVPVADTNDSGIGRAEQIVLANCPDAAPRIRRVGFSMAQRRGVGAERQQAWQSAADAAAQAFLSGATIVAFATVGDPSVYSTFSYLAAHVRAALPDLAVTVVPGITAMQALAAAACTPLVEAQEVLALVPVTAGLEAVADALDHADTVVAYKGGRHLPALRELVHERRPDATAVVGVDLGLDEEQLMPLDEATTDTAPYFSTVLVAPARTRTGGRL